MYTFIVPSLVLLYGTPTIYSLDRSVSSYQYLSAGFTNTYNYVLEGTSLSSSFGVNRGATELNMLIFNFSTTDKLPLYFSISTIHMI